MQKNIKNYFWLAVKISFAVIAIVFIYLKIRNFKFSDFTFPSFSYLSISLFCTVILLMPINWFIESVKWKYLIQKLEKIRFSGAFKAILSGIAFALVSPNRIGEPAGRIFILKKRNQGKAFFATIIGSLSQMLITLIVGLSAGLIFLFSKTAELKEINSDQLFYLKIISTFSVTVGLLFLFNLKYLIIILKKLGINKKFIRYINFLSEYSAKELFIVLILSFLRYLIFSLQFILLLYFFNIKISFFDAFLGIALTYLVSSLVPVLSFLEIGIRGTTAIIFLGMFSDNIPGILSAVAFLWFINLAIPAAAGTFIFYRTKIQ